MHHYPLFELKCLWTSPLLPTVAAKPLGTLIFAIFFKSLGPYAGRRRKYIFVRKHKIGIHVALTYAVLT